jgi:hypothetical protein
MKYWLLILCIYGIGWSQTSESGASNQPHRPLGDFTVVAPIPEQRLMEQTLNVQGRAFPGTIIRARTLRDTADHEGNWRINIRGPQRPGKFRLKVEAFYEGEVKSIYVPFIVMDSLDIRDSLRKLHGGEVFTERKSSDRARVAVFNIRTTLASAAQLQIWREALVPTLTYPELVKASDLRIPRFEIFSPENCADFECAMNYTRFNRIDYGIIGSLQLREGRTLLTLEIISPIDGGSVYRLRKDVHPTFEDISQVLQAAGKELNQRMEELFKPTPALTAVTGEWQSSDFDPHTAHLRGTRLPRGILKDTLYTAKSPYILSFNAVIPPGEKLYIQKGVRLFIGGENTGITVYGQLVAQGTAEDPIIITSGRQSVKPGDWNRIAFASNSRSVLEHVQLNYAKDAIVVENSALTGAFLQISHVLHNGIYASNSDVLITDSKLSNALAAVHAGSHSEVEIQRSEFSGNRAGLVVTDLGTAKLIQSNVLNNERGIILLDTVAFTVTDSRIRDNQTGVSYNQSEVPEMRGVRNNRVDFTRVAKETVMEFISIPTIAGVPLDAQVRRPGFTPGVYSTRKGLDVSFLGNLNIGTEYHYLTTAQNTTIYPEPGLAEGDTIFPGDRYPNDKQIPGFIHRTSVYAMAGMGDHSLEFSMDGRYDDWVERLYPDMLTMRYQAPWVQLQLGDFTETGTEISVASRSMFGARAQMQLGTNKWNKPWLQTTFLAAETKRPLDIGQKDPEGFPNVATDGDLIPQEILKMGKVQFYTSPTARITVGFMESDQQRENLWGRNSIDLAAETRDAMLTSRTLFLDYDWTNLAGNLAFIAQFAVGSADSLTLHMDNALTKWQEEYGPLADEAMVKRYLRRGTQAGAIPTDSLRIMVPSLENDAQRVEYLQTLFTDIGTLESSSLDDYSDQKLVGMMWGGKHYAFQTGVDWNVFKASIQSRFQYIGNNYYTAGNPYITQNSRKFNNSLTRNITPWLDLSIIHETVIENAVNQGQNAALGFGNFFGLGEGSILGLYQEQAYLDQFQRKEVRPRYTTTLRSEKMFKLNPQMDLDVKVGFQKKSQYMNRFMVKDTSDRNGVYSDPWFRGTGYEKEYLNEIVTLDAARWEQFKDAADTLAGYFQEQEYTHSLNLGWRWRFSRQSNLRVETGYQLRLDGSTFHQDFGYNQFKLADTTWQKMGYLFNGTKQQEIDLQVALLNRMGGLTNRITLRPKWRFAVREDEKRFEWTLSDRADYSLLQNKVRLTLDAGLIHRTSDREFKDLVLRGPNEVEYSYYNREGETVVPVLEPSASSLRISLDEAYPEGYSVRRKYKRRVEKELDFYVKTIVRYTFTPQLYSEALLNVESYQRENNLSQEYRHIWGALQLYYSF